MFLKEILQISDESKCTQCGETGCRPGSRRPLCEQIVHTDLDLPESEGKKWTGKLNQHQSQPGKKPKDVHTWTRSYTFWRENLRAVYVDKVS